MCNCKKCLKLTARLIALLLIVSVAISLCSCKNFAENVYPRKNKKITEKIEKPENKMVKNTNKKTENKTKNNSTENKNSKTKKRSASYDKKRKKKIKSNGEEKRKKERKSEQRTTPDIGRERVIRIVLAKVPGTERKNIVELERDFDEGICVYEGELHYKGLEYEFEIDGRTGNILKWEIDD